MYISTMDKLAQLEWQREMGVDESLSHDPVDNATEHNKEEPAPSPKTSEFAEESKVFAKEVKKPAKVSGPLEAAEQARKIADKCKTLDELREAVENFDGLAITKTATNTVFSDGNPEADIMFIGEAPGANEDLEGIPFCGASGKLMDEIIKWAGFSRKDNIYISNTIFWRPPGNRRPTPEEIQICKPFVEKHIALINPKLIALIGGTATFALLDTKTGITKLRGKSHDYTNKYLSAEIPAMALFHPSYLLRQPSQKGLFWADILSIKHKTAS